jgi:two-component system chemotaxis response regulator CheB
MTKVLVVDDSALMRRLIGGVLTEAGFQVDTARNGAEGLERLLEGSPMSSRSTSTCPRWTG